MMIAFRLGFASPALLMLCACDPATPVDPAANQVDNFAIEAVNDAAQPLEPRRDTDPQPARVPDKTDQEPIMPTDPSTTSPPAKPSTPPRARPPAPPAPRVIERAPNQPPTEVDPVQPHPGDEVPR